MNFGFKVALIDKRKNGSRATSKIKNILISRIYSYYVLV